MCVFPINSELLGILFYFIKLCDETSKSVPQLAELESGVTQLSLPILYMHAVSEMTNPCQIQESRSSFGNK